MHEVVRWNDEDAITRDSLHMRADAIVLDDVISLEEYFLRRCLCARNNSRRAGQIFIKFLMDVVPLEANLKSYFLIF
jgi:hypothetical protein